MILFSQDWAQYSASSIHYKTRNPTFVTICAKYREMGIKNHAFPLALINPELEDVDPHDPNLDFATQLAINVECRINPWYFFREVARAPGIGTDEPTIVEANRANIALWWCFFNHVDIFLIQPRQTGKSFSTDVLMSLLMNVICQNTEINLMTKNDDLMRANVDRIKKIVADLPAYMTPKSRDDANNGEELTVKARGNRYRTHVPQSSPKAALKMGRGLTSPIFHIDEPPFQSNIGIALGAALAASGAAREKAAAANVPYGNIFTTTAGSKDDKDGKFIYNLLQASATWTEKYFDARDQQHLHEIIRANSPGKIVQINATFSYRQLGKSDEWMRERLESSRQEGQDANRDFFNLWTSGTESSPFDTDTADALARQQRSSVWVSLDEIGGYAIHWYFSEAEITKRLATRKIIMAMDPSEAGGGDDIGMTLMDTETLEVLGTGRYNTTNTIVFSKWICSLICKWENVTAIIEARSTGRGILDYLLLFLPERGQDPFKRLFNRIVNDRDSNPERFAEIEASMNRRPSNIYDRYKMTFGFATSGAGITSRTDLYSATLKNAVRTAGDKIYAPDLTQQILGLVIKNGRVDHETGQHDDLVIAWLLAHWLINNGRNLSHYGINVQRIAAQVQSGKQETPVQLHQRYQQARYRARLEEIYTQLGKERDAALVLKLESEVRAINKELVLEEGELFSIEQFIQQARDKRRTATRERELNRGGNDYSYGQRFQNTPDTVYYH